MSEATYHYYPEAAYSVHIGLAPPRRRTLFDRIGSLPRFFRLTILYALAAIIGGLLVVLYAMAIGDWPWASFFAGMVSGIASGAATILLNQMVHRARSRSHARR